MKIAFGLGHPAHFHLYKNVIRLLQQKHIVDIYITNKDILKKLLDDNNLTYTIIASSEANEDILTKFKKLFYSTKTLYSLIKNNPPDIFVSCISQLNWISWFLRKGNIFNAEDDITYTYLQGIITYPFVNTILTSKVVKVWPFTYKQIGYAGYHKLAYLHPNWFNPDVNIKNQYIKDPSYSIIRVVNQNAYHDINAQGLDINTLRSIVNHLKKYGVVYISSEKPLPVEFQSYKLKINESDIHHILYYANIFVGDSQSMTVEAAMLGTPSIRINNFANKISIIKELEFVYGLTYSISPNNKEKVELLINEIMSVDRQEFRNRRDNMLNEKIDVTSFFNWFIENYPESKTIMSRNPKFQFNFK